MGIEGIDPADFRAAQESTWGAAAVGWKEWSEFNDRAARHISERLVELAGARPGSRVLDVAAGNGEPALTAARVVGPEGSVVATDIAAEMLAFGRERAAEAGLGNVEFVHSDAAGLEFPPETFDAAVSRWGIIFEPEAEGAAERIRGFLKRGGRIAIASWGKPEEVPFLSIPIATTLERFGIPPLPQGLPGPMSRPTPEALGALLEGGGFGEVAAERAEVVYEFESPQHFTEYVKAVAAPIRVMIEVHGGDAQDEAWDAITRAVAGATGGSAPLRLTNVVVLASGTA